MDADKFLGEKKPAVSEITNKNVFTVVSSIAGFAFGTFVLGALFAAPWPGAVASCGLSVMGVGVAYFMLHRG